MKRRAFVFAFVSILIVSCSSGTSEEYALFKPSNESYFRIAFEYPADWKWEIIDGDLSVDSAIMKISDPTEEIQTPLSASCLDEANISIVVVLNENPSKVLDTEKSAIQYGVTGTDFWEIQQQKELEIAGVPAYMMVMKENSRHIDKFAQCTSKIDVTTVYFLLASDRLYKISYAAPEDRQGTEFHQDFVHLIETIRAIP